MQLGSHLLWAGIRESILNYIGDFLIPTKHLTESFLRQQFSNERTMNQNSIFPWYLFDQAVLILTTCSNCSNVDPTTRGDGKTKTGSVEHTDKKDWLRWGRVAKFQSASFSEIVRACDCCQKYFTCSLHHDPSSLSPGHWGGQGWPQRPPLYLETKWFGLVIWRWNQKKGSFGTLHFLDYCKYYLVSDPKLSQTWSNRPTTKNKHRPQRNFDRQF